MCLIFLSLHTHPTYKLIIAANRDEFYGRKTAPVTYWEDHPDILGGRDLEAKVTRVKDKFDSLLKAPKLQPGTLLDALYDEQRAPAQELPETGVGSEWEQALSSMFIKTGSYGTRCSTVVLVDKQNEVSYSER